MNVVLAKDFSPETHAYLHQPLDVVPRGVHAHTRFSTCVLQYAHTRLQ